MKTIHAVYERGMFRPLEVVELPEKCEVEFEPRPVKPADENGQNLSAIYAILSEMPKCRQSVARRHSLRQVVIS